MTLFFGVLPLDNGHFISVTDSKYQPFVPRKIRRIINKAVSTNPEERYQTVLEMRRALEQLFLKGDCSSNENGDVVITSGGKEFRYIVIPVTEKTSNFIVYQKNIKTGRETKATKYCSNSVKNIDVKKRYFHW